MGRAWSGLQLKSLTETDTHYQLQGIATTPTPDRMQDIVEPMGGEYELPLPLLWQHDAEKPIGEVVEAQATSKGIAVVMQIPKHATSATLKARIDEAVESVKLGLVRGLSIGFKPIEYAYMEDTGGYRFLKWELLELSCVTVPANQDASISAIKSFDRMHGGSASSARAHKVVRLSSAVTGAKPLPIVRLSAAALSVTKGRPVVRLSAAAKSSSKARKVVRLRSTHAWYDEE
jgi:HK97 family phage prohead protease